MRKAATHMHAHRVIAGYTLSSRRASRPSARLLSGFSQAMYHCTHHRYGDLPVSGAARDTGHPYGLSSVITGHVCARATL